MPYQIEPNDNFIDALLVAIPEPFFVIDENGYYVQVLGGVDRKKYHDGQHLIGKRMHDVLDVELADQFLVLIKRAIKSGQVIDYVYKLSAENIKGSENLPGPEGQIWFEAHISPIKKTKGQPRMVVWVAFNITELQNTVMEKDSLILDLQKAISEIKTLRGFLPICAQCKKIRDDKGYWNQIESYIHNHSEAEFTHSLCPDCVKKLYPELDMQD